MEKRKNPEKELRNKSGLFFQIGLLIAMMVCVSAFEYRTKSIANDPIDLTGMVDEIIIPPITIQDPPPPPPKPKNINVVVVPDTEPEPIPDGLILDLPDLGDIEVEPIEEPPVVVAPETFTVVESMPEPDGGIAGFYKFVQKNLKYPAAPRRMGIEGKVFVQFVIDEKGELVEFEILRGIHTDCDNEVLRIMEKAPKWKPGKQRGVPVRVKRVLPIEFRLN
jgi:protein TonB